MALKIAAGVILGILVKPISQAVALRLLTARDLDGKVEKKQSLILFLLSATAGGAITWVSDGIPEAIYLFLLTSVCETVAITDILFRRIPNELVLAVILLTLLFGIPGTMGAKGFPQFDIFRSLIGMAVCFVIFTLPAAFGKSVGAGDIKLAAAAGFAMGLDNSLLAIALMGMLILLSMKLQRSVPAAQYLQQMIPMGPFLAAAMMGIMIYVRIPA